MSVRSSTICFEETAGSLLRRPFTPVDLCSNPPLLIHEFCCFSESMFAFCVPNCDTPYPQLPHQHCTRTKLALLLDNGLHEGTSKLFPSPVTRRPRRITKSPVLSNNIDLVVLIPLRERKPPTTKQLLPAATAATYHVRNVRRIWYRFALFT